MKNEKSTTEIRGTKRLSLEDFKLEKLNDATVLSTAELSNALGGVAPEVASRPCVVITGPLDDCHS